MGRVISHDRIEGKDHFRYKRCLNPKPLPKRPAPLTTWTDFVFIYECGRSWVGCELARPFIKCGYYRVDQVKPAKYLPTMLATCPPSHRP